MAGTSSGRWYGYLYWCGGSECAVVVNGTVTVTAAVAVVVSGTGTGIGAVAVGW